MNKKAAVGMSGGVDSSAAAYLLKSEGYEVFGCSLKMYKGAESADTRDARAVAEKLGISFSAEDYSDGFDETVIKYFTDEYLGGKTPNPCVFCNRNMKFPCMLAYADKIGSSFIATGHYARIKEDNGRFLLLRGADRKKDQSYMLCMLTQDILSRTLFPVGDLTKDEIRTIATEIGLSVADKKDSQDICFIKGTDYSTFIKEKLGCDIPHGNFTDCDGNILGEHKGIISYTIGQRKGLGISSEEPYYVIDKKTCGNTVVLGREQNLYSSRVLVKNINYIPFDELKSDIRASAKLRYSSFDSPCRVIPSENGAVLEFDAPQRAVTPGQAAVIYDGDTVIGGGEIVGAL